MQDRVEVPEVHSVTLVGLSVHVNPIEGDTEDVRDTVPVNEWIDARAIVELPAVPALTTTLVRPAVIEKSGTATL